MDTITKLCYHDNTKLHIGELINLRWVDSWDSDDDVPYRTYLTAVDNTEENQDKYCKWFTNDYEIGDILLITIEKVIDPGGMFIISADQFNADWKERLQSQVILSYESQSGFDIQRLVELNSVEERQEYIESFIRPIEYCKPIKLVCSDEFELQVLSVTVDSIGDNTCCIQVRDFNFIELNARFSEYRGIKISNSTKLNSEFTEAIKEVQATINNIMK